MTPTDKSLADVVAELRALKSQHDEMLKKGPWYQDVHNALVHGLLDHADLLLTAASRASGADSGPAHALFLAPYVATALAVLDRARVDTALRAITAAYRQHNGRTPLVIQAEAAFSPAPASNSPDKGRW